ncbi:MAG: D-alanine--D-alanine ligase [Firmicutes bacterium]|nr:D-alanine--D-alanine ligase [Bacillota bacterium]
MEKITVGVIFGGRTVEHEVSIISALQAMLSLDTDKYQVVPIYISKEGRWYSGDNLMKLENFRDMPALLKQAREVCYSPAFGEQILFERFPARRKIWQQRIDVMLPVVHGTFVEDGCLQGLLELSGIPYAGPGVLGSACGMDKIAMKAVLKEADIPVVDFYGFYFQQWQEDQQKIVDILEEKLRYPLIVKPANLGSSVGIGLARDRETLISRIETAGEYACRILVENAVEPLREINCAVLGKPGDIKLSLCEEPYSKEEILSFADKYLSSSAKGMSGAKRRIPADLPDQTAEEIRSLAARAFTALDCRGVCRVDFLLNGETGRVYVNELNTIPGSLSFYLFEPAGVPYGELLDTLIELAIDRKRQQSKLNFCFDSNILSQSGFSGKK